MKVKIVERVDWPPSGILQQPLSFSSISTSAQRLHNSNDMSLSDLELVAQAMAPTNQAASSGEAKKQEAEARALSEKSQGQQQSGRSHLLSSPIETGVASLTSRSAGRSATPRILAG